MCAHARELSWYSSSAFFFTPSLSVWFLVRPYSLFHAVVFGFAENNFGEIADLNFQEYKCSQAEEPLN